jgi:protein phosphatase
MSATKLQDTTIPRPVRSPDWTVFVPAAPRVAVELAGLTHPGKLRSNNEDNFAVIRRMRRQEVVLSSQPTSSFPSEADQAHLLMMADGMGGAAFGELASSLAIRTVWSLSEESMGWIMKIAEFDPVVIKERVDAYVERIQQAFCESAATRPQASGMGTTMTSIYVMGWDAIVVQIGDSRAYLFRQGNLRRLTRDHTVAEQLNRLGMGAELSDSFRHILTSCLGGDAKSARPDIDYQRLQPGDVLVLATDGLTDVVPEDRIVQRLGERSDLRAVCQTLVQDALERGGPDNITVVTARFSEAGDD